MVMRRALPFVLVAAASFAAGLIVTYHPGEPNAAKEEDLVDHSVEGTLGLTNPLLACGDISDLSIGTIEDLRNGVEDLVNTATAKGSVSHAAVYVRDLNNGPWMGIHEKEFFYPASLLKVPLIFAAYREEEAHPGFLEKTSIYSQSLVSGTYLFPPAEHLTLGTSYSARELLRSAITYSDNESAALLGDKIGFGNLSKVFSDFGIV